MRPARGVLWASLALLLAMALGLPGFAQEAAGDDDDLGGIDEIIVTAERRAQSLQDVAQTISAFTLEDLTKRNIQDISDLQLEVPSLVATAGLPAITLRGIGQDTEVLGPGIDPGFQLHINGIYTTQLAIALLGFHDLERVEVLPGPQGTLYGRNSTGGTINLLTKRPDLEVHEISGEFEVGAYDKFRARGVVNLPIVEGELAARFAWLQEYPDKAIDAKGSNGHDQRLSSGTLSGGTSLRFSLRWTPSEDVSTDVIASWSRNNGPGSTGRFAGDYIPFNAGANTLFTSVRNLNSATPNPSNPKSVRRNRQQEQRYETLWLQTITTIEMPYDLELKLNGNYQYWDYLLNTDGDSSDLDAVSFTLEDKSVTWSGEATISSNWDGPFNFIFGGNYQSVDAPDTEVPFVNHQDNAALSDFYLFNAFDLPISGTNRALTDPEINRICGGPCTLSPAKEGFSSFHPDSDTLTESIGVFLNFNYDVTEEVRFTGGLRYSYTGREFDDSGATFDIFNEAFDVATVANCALVGFTVPTDAACLFLIGAGIVTANPGLNLNIGDLTAANTAFLFPVKSNLDATTLNTAAYAREKSWNSLTWMARLEWRPILGQLLYASVQTGERAGGFQFASAPFDEEEITAYEIGAKNVLADGTMFLNTSVFYYDFKDRFIQQVENNIPFIENVPESTVLGAEIQLLWQATPELRINASVGWLDAEITGDFVTQDNTLSVGNPDGFCAFKPVGDQHGTGPTCDGPIPQNIKGNSLPRAPEWSVRMGASYGFEFASGVLTPRVDVSWRDGFDFRWFDNPLDRAFSYWRVDVRARWDPHDSWWWAEAYVQNLNNEEEARTQLAGTTTGRSFNVVKPISWGVRFGYTFQDAQLPWVD